MTTEIEIIPGEEYVFKAGRRTAHLWLHDCEHCTSVDLWTDRGREHEAISAGTRDTTRAPSGLAVWVGSRRPETGIDTAPSSHGWPAASTINLIWDDTP